MNTHPEQFRDVLPPDEVLIEPSGQFGNDLRNFRAAAHRAAERQASEPVPFGWLNAAKRRRRQAQRRLMFALVSATACVALLFAAALPTLHHSKPVTEAAVHQSNADDTALLEQVDTAVSESVPSSLAPLDALDNLDTKTSTDTQTSLSKPEKKNVSQ